MNQLAIVKLVATVMAGKTPDEADIHKFLESLNLNYSILSNDIQLESAKGSYVVPNIGTNQRIEDGIVDLAKSALTPGAIVIEMKGPPKILNGKRIRLVAVIE